MEARSGQRERTNDFEGHVSGDVDIELLLIVLSIGAEKLLRNFCRPPTPWDGSFPRSFLHSEAKTLISREDRFYDTPTQNQRFSKTDVSRLLDTKKDAMEAITSIIFLCVHKGLLDDDVGVARGNRVRGELTGSQFQNRRFR